MFFFVDLPEGDYSFTNDIIYDPYSLETSVPMSGIYNSHVSNRFFGPLSVIS